MQHCAHICVQPWLGIRPIDPRVFKPRVSNGEPKGRPPGSLLAQLLCVKVWAFFSCWKGVVFKKNVLLKFENSVWCVPSLVSPRVFEHCLSEER
jgi:hypothetical protein